jgi:ATP-dependent DNA helicase RecQ
VLPTGWGKSAIYQLAALLIPGPTVVVSPLIALQRDQVRSLLANDVAAAEANSQMGPADRRRALDHLASGDVEFVFLAPEQLAKDEVVDEIAAARPSLFVVDEAHCISTWGHDFRPDYLTLASVVTAVGRPPVLALTATAAPPVREEIVERLELADPVVVVRGFDRPNISLGVQRFVEADEKRTAVVERAATAEGAGIVYVATRRSAEEVAEALHSRRVAAAAYHAGLPAAERNATQAAFTGGDVRVVVATTAFGMGIDKPDVRFVHHHDVAESLDAYYQEIGRAGRDGDPAEAVLFYRPEDLGMRRYFASGGDDETRRRVEQSRVEMMQAYAEARGCRRRLLLGYFGEQLDGRCGKCDQCRSSDGEEAADPAGRAPFELNARVTHTAWGDGQVLGYEGDVVTVFFDSVGYKTLDLDLVAAGGLLRPSGGLEG